MRYLSVCSGIEAATVAWHPLGWTPAAFSEIEAFPSAVLAHHYPGVPNAGDFTTIHGDEYGSIDLLVGGTPCQDFSIAGLRAGVAGERGNLTLEFLRLAHRLRPRWLVWENVPGVLSSITDDAPDHSGDGDGRWSDDANETHAFACFLAGLQELGYGFAYRTLDAQYFGVPQRRRRIFAVGYLGDWRRSAAVLFERHSLSGYPPPRREAGKIPPAGTLRSVNGGSDVDDARAGHLIASTGDTAHCLNAGGMGRQDYETETLITQPVYTLAIRGRGDSHELEYRTDGTANAILTPNGGRGGIGVGAIAIQERALCENPNAGPDGAGFRSDDTAYTLEARTVPQAACARMAVRRLTPRECERLQGFPDDYTLIPFRGKPAADGPRYKALGNSMAVPVMRWIGERIAAVEAI